MTLSDKTTVYKSLFFIFIILISVIPILITLIEGSNLSETGQTIDFREFISSFRSTEGVLLIISGLLLLFSTVSFLYIIGLQLFTKKAFRYPLSFSGSPIGPMPVIIGLSLIYILGLLITGSIGWSSISNNNDKDVPLYTGTLMFFEFLALLTFVFVSTYILNEKRDEIMLIIEKVFQKTNENCNEYEGCLVDLGPLLKDGLLDENFLDTYGLRQETPKPLTKPDTSVQDAMDSISSSLKNYQDKVVNVAGSINDKVRDIMKRQSRVHNSFNDLEPIQPSPISNVIDV